MGNLILNFGSVSGPLVLFVCAAYLHSQGHTGWVRFFNTGIFLGVWGALWTICYSGIRNYLTVRMEQRRGNSDDVIMAYVVALSVCIIGTAIGGIVILRLV